MNLLTGLAVDETSEIQKNAEVSSQVIRVKVIWQMEKACPLLWSRSKKVTEKKPLEEWPVLDKVEVNGDLCKCKFVCIFGSENSWWTELLKAVKKRREEQKIREDQEKPKDQERKEQMEMFKMAVRLEREEQMERKEQMEMFKMAVRLERE